MMLSLKSQTHPEHLVESLQSKSSLDILVAGCDSVSSPSERLWILSPLVRETIGSLAGLVRAQEPLIILPDFTQEDIERALEIVRGDVRDNIILNSATKDILETLGILLTNLKVAKTVMMLIMMMTVMMVVMIFDDDDDGNDDKSYAQST